jgi:hypothetical protein
VVLAQGNPLSEDLDIACPDNAVFMVSQPLNPAIHKIIKAIPYKWDVYLGLGSNFTVHRTFTLNEQGVTRQCNVVYRGLGISGYMLLWCSSAERIPSIKVVCHNQCATSNGSYR